MQSISDTGGDCTADPFATLVDAVRSSLSQPATSTAPTVPANLLHPVRLALLHPAPAASSSAASVSPMARPVTFTGAAEDCSGFLLQCSLYLEAQSQLFTTERSRVVFVIFLLTGRALQWAQPLWESNAPVTASINSFAHFEVFGQSTTELSIHNQIFNLRQNDESVSMYALRFRTLVAASGWNETALITAFRYGLNPHVKQLMVVYDDTMGLENLIQKTIRIAQHYSACALLTPTANPLPATLSVALPAPEAMHVDSYHLTLTQYLCLYCGGEDPRALHLSQERLCISLILMSVFQRKPSSTPAPQGTSSATRFSRN